MPDRGKLDQKGGVFYWTTGKGDARTSIKIDTRMLRALYSKMPDEVDKISMALMDRIRLKIIETFNTSPPGRRYGKHVASQPGYPPNIWYGKLRDSAKIVPTDRKNHYALVFDVHYAIVLEFGNDKIKARPFIRPVVRSYARSLALYKDVRAMINEKIRNIQP
jgi:hypothetical protein